MPVHAMNQETPRMGLRRSHVVVVLDDEPSILTSLQRLLRGEPYGVRTTTWSRQVIEWVTREEVSLVVSDYRMPEATGLAVLEEVRKASPRTLCVILTGYPSQALEKQAEERGVRCMLVKPWDDVDLKRTLRLLLREWELKEPGNGHPARE